MTFFLLIFVLLTSFFLFSTLSISHYLFHHLFMPFYAIKSIFCVTNISLLHSFPFLSLCLLSCLCNRLYILPQVLNLSLLLLCQFLLALVFPFPVVPPASHTHSTSCSIPSLPCLLPWQDPFVRAVASALGCPCTPTSLSCHSLPWTGAGFAYLQFWGCIPK